MKEQLYVKPITYDELYTKIKKQKQKMMQLEKKLKKK